MGPLKKISSGVKTRTEQFRCSCGKLLRCYANLPAPFFKAEGISKNWEYDRDTLIAEVRKQFRSAYDSALDAAHGALRAAIAASNDRLEEAGTQPAFTLSNDEVRLLAGLRLLKSYGAAKAALVVERCKCADLIVETIRRDSPSKT